ncbi:MAG: TPM domain-containing protein [Deltaproteobacteria bacterium]|nr:TPM domain-containing protein [Deltaproteobacteria bacterium]
MKGVGLEKVISDDFAKRIIEENMVPAFRKKQFSEGLEE